MQIGEVSTQLRANYQECDQCGRELLQAADAVDIMEAALIKIANEPIPEQASLFSDAWRMMWSIARKALETKL